ncbi:MAG: ATP-dependent DNA helicase RecG [Bacteroidia bacterium]|nr:ATP-dependent DNA helicase RecG [Bacteroidia bacterium]
MGCLNDDIQFLPGVGPKRAELLKKELSLSTFGDLLHFYPFRYTDRSRVCPIAELDSSEAQVQVVASIVSVSLYGPQNVLFYRIGPEGEVNNFPIDARSGARTIRFNAVKRLTLTVADSSGRMEMVFFKGIKWSFSRYRSGGTFIFLGRPQSYNGRFSIVHPEVDPLPPGTALISNSRPSANPTLTQQPSANPALTQRPSANPAPPLSEEPHAPSRPAAGTAPLPGGTLTGVYASTEKLKTSGITNKVMTRLVGEALSKALPEVRETLPDYVLKEKELVPLRFALRNIHFPTDADALSKARYRLKFEELFFLQLSLLKQKYIHSRSENGIMMPRVGAAFNACYSALPYPLTGAQKKVIKEIRSDMMSGHQMNRLLQGDVGSGKTMVAVLSCLIAVGNGYQACIMAPTEVLAQQHYANVSRYLAPTGVRCALLTGSSTAKQRREIHAGLEDGGIGIIIGTHALIEDDVRFRRLGLAVIDEQHRFGVDQRSKLWAKGPERGVALAGSPAAGKMVEVAPEAGGVKSGEREDRLPPHVLVMTATPIPRTLAMTLYGDLDVSVIDEMPPGRKPVQTIQIGQNRRAALHKFMREQIAKGRQVFVVYPLIFESEKMDLKNLQQGYEDIVRAFPLPQYKVAIVHGQQSAEEKNFNMSAFAAGRAQILVSTTVIEVGVDVPNASLMVIESAQRFGLSQLHQLRGRVGRGAEKSFCILVRDEKVSKESKRRLDLMCETENGFEIAEEDMKMRGPGDLDGTMQSGLPVSLKIASLASDGGMLAQARSYAEMVLERDPTLSQERNALLAAGVGEEVKDYSKIS